MNLTSHQESLVQLESLINNEFTKQTFMTENALLDILLGKDLIIQSINDLYYLILRCFCADWDYRHILKNKWVHSSKLDPLLKENESYKNQIIHIKKLITDIQLSNQKSILSLILWQILYFFELWLSKYLENNILFTRFNVIELINFTLDSFFEVITDHSIKIEKLSNLQKLVIERFINTNLESSILWLETNWKKWIMQAQLILSCCISAKKAWILLDIDYVRLNHMIDLSKNISWMQKSIKELESTSISQTKFLIKIEK